MKQSIHIYVGIPVTITHIKQEEIHIICFFVDTMIMLVIDISLYNEESFRSSNKLVKFFNNCRVIFIRSSSQKNAFFAKYLKSCYININVR